MPAQLQNDDIQAGLEMAWHGMTKVLPVITFDDAFPYEIERVEIECCPGWSYFRASDTGNMIGRPVAETYHAITNARFWEIIQNSLGGTGAVIESAGTIYGRTRRFVTARLGTDMDKFVVGNREFQNRLSLVDSIDMSTNFYGVNTSICIVCANTARMVMDDKSGEFRFKLRHTKGLVAKIENMEKAIDNFVGVSAQFKAALEIAANEPIKTDDARALFAGFAAGGDSTTELSTRSLNIVGRMTELFQRGAGNKGETLLDAYSAVTDYYSHESSGGQEKEGFRWRQYLSSEFGAGADAKTTFLRELVKPEKDGAVNFRRDNVQGLVKVGEAVLKKAELVLP